MAIISFLEDFFLLYLIMYMRLSMRAVSACGSTQVPVEAGRVGLTLWLELQVVVRCLTWVLVIELTSFVRAACALITSISLIPPHIHLLKVPPPMAVVVEITYYHEACKGHLNNEVFYAQNEA